MQICVCYVKTLKNCISTKCDFLIRYFGKILFPPKNKVFQDKNQLLPHKRAMNVRSHENYKLPKNRLFTKRVYLYSHTKKYDGFFQRYNLF